MVRVLLIGGSGFVGGALVTALRQSNHRVYAVARTPEKAKYLAEKEVIVISGSLDDSAALVKAVEEENIDVIVDLTASRDGTYKILEDLAPVAKNRLKKLGSKIGFVYVSGLWVHGSSLKPVSDLDIVGKGAPSPPADAVAWRPELEAKVLASKDLFDVAVVRPALVYGSYSPIWGYAFGPILAAVEKGDGDKELTIELDDVAIGLVHNDDAAASIKAAIEKLPSIVGTGIYPVFNASTSYESLLPIVRRAAKVLGFTGELKFVAPSEGNAFGRAFGTTINVGSDRATALLGWQPTRHSMLADVEIYASSWKAANATK